LGPEHWWHMTVQSLSSSDSVRSPFLFILLAGLSAAAYAEDERDSSADPACPRVEVLAHVQAQFRLYGPLSERREYFGFVYRSNGEVESSVAIGNVCSSNQFCGLKIAPAAKAIPAGAKVLGEWHTHPRIDGSRNLSVADVRGAFQNRHIRCYSAFYSAPNGDIYRWDVSQTSVPTAMNTREYVGNHHDPPAVAVADLQAGKVRPLAELPEKQ